MAGETGASDVTDPKDGGLKTVGDLPSVSWAGTNDKLGEGSITQMHKDQAKVTEELAAVTQHLDSPASEGNEAPLGKGNIAEMFGDQEAAGEDAAALAKLIADVPTMAASETTASGETSYPLLDALAARWSGGGLRAMLGKPGTQLEKRFSTGGPDILTNPSRGQSMQLGGTFDGLLRKPSTKMEDYFPAAGKSESETYADLLRIANTDIIKSVTDYKAGELPQGEVKWTKSQIDEIKVAAMLRDLANQDVIGDSPFAKMVGGVAGAARKVREGVRSVGSKVGGLRGLAGKSGGGGGEPPTTPPAGSPPAAL